MKTAASSDVDAAPIRSMTDGFRTFFPRHPEAELDAPGFDPWVTSGGPVGARLERR